MCHQCMISSNDGKVVSPSSSPSFSSFAHGTGWRRRPRCAHAAGVLDARAAIGRKKKRRRRKTQGRRPRKWAEFRPLLGPGAVPRPLLSATALAEAERPPRCGLWVRPRPPARHCHKRQADVPPTAFSNRVSCMRVHTDDSVRGGVLPVSKGAGIQTGHV